MHEDISAAEVERRIASCHRSVGQFFAYWREKCGASVMPRRSDIDPVELKRYLPSIILVDVVPDLRRFVYRLVGTKEVAGRGYDPTGKSVAESFYGESREAALACYEYVAREKRPFCIQDPYVTADGWQEAEDALYLPLSEDGIEVSMVLVYSYTYDFRARTENTFRLR